MGERPGPQTEQRVLRGPDQPKVGRPRHAEEDDHDHGGDSTGRRDEGRPEPLFAEQAAVENDLDHHRDGELATGGGHGHEHREDEALLELGRGCEASTEHGDRADGLLGRVLAEVGMQLGIVQRIAFAHTVPSS